MTIKNTQMWVQKENLSLIKIYLFGVNKKEARKEIRLYMYILGIILPQVIFTVILALMG